MNEDEKYYQQVADELRANGPNEGLWLKALTVANADHEKARVLYVKWRVEQMISAEEQQRKGEEELRKKERTFFYTIKCPKCHLSERIPVNSYKDPSAYKLFNITYNFFLSRVKLICSNCKNKFKFETGIGNYL